MLGINGLQLRQSIRGKYKDIQKLMITNYSLKEKKQQIISFGIDVYPKKPFVFKELKKLIMALMFNQPSVVK
jgi:DNA-binding response OmpR family regulator